MTVTKKNVLCPHVCQSNSHPKMPAVRGIPGVVGVGELEHQLGEHDLHGAQEVACVEGEEPVHVLPDLHEAVPGAVHGVVLARREHPLAFVPERRGNRVRRAGADLLEWHQVNHRLHLCDRGAPEHLALYHALQVFHDAGQVVAPDSQDVLHGGPSRAANLDVGPERLRPHALPVGEHQRAERIGVWAVIGSQNEQRVGLALVLEQVVDFGADIHL